MTHSNHATGAGDGPDTGGLAVSGEWGPVTRPVAQTVGELAEPAVVVPSSVGLQVLGRTFERDAELRAIVLDRGDEGLVLLRRADLDPALHLGRGPVTRRRGAEPLRLEPAQLTGTVVVDASTSVLRAAGVLINCSRPLDWLVVTGPGDRIGLAPSARVFETLAQHYAHESLHDPLTGLPNRSHLAERLAASLRSPRASTVFFIDLDRFKDVNDQHGHDAGDQVLTEFADRLRHLARADDLVVRLGGDEFALLVEGPVPRGGRDRVADRICARAAEPFLVQTSDPTGGADVPTHVRIGASVGIAHTDGTGTTPPEALLDLLLRQSDLAMYRAKSQGRGRHAHFEPEVDAAEVAATRARRTVERALRAAIGTSAMQVHYQPVVRLPSGRVLGAEALARWFDPELGRVTPDVFIPVAESTGLIVDLGRWVLNTACREATRWRGRPGVPEPTVAVNVSAVQLAQRSFVADVIEALHTSGLAPHRLVLEITETAAVTDLHETAERLTALREQGVRLALDDFGTGHSSLTMLRALPVHTVKIDRSFVEHVADRAQDAVLVRLVVDAAHSLGLEVCAEGVESPAQAGEMVSLGCDEAQGWLFGRPEPTSAKLREVLGGRLSVGPDVVTSSSALAFGSSDELVLVTTPERVVTYASSSLGPMLGYLPSELVGVGIRDVLRSSDLHTDVGQKVPGMQEKGATLHRVFHRDGSSRWLLSRTEWLHDHEGLPREVLSISRDVTRAVDSQLALAESEARFRFAFDDSPTPMAIARLDGMYVRVNAAHAQLLGRSAQEMCALTVGDLTHPDDRDVDASNFDLLRGGDTARQVVEKRYLHADGHAVAVTVTVSVLPDREGAPGFVVARVEPRT